MTIVCLAVTTDIAVLLRSVQSSKEPMSTSELAETRTGKIVLNTDLNDCKEMKFDNSSGRVIEGFSPCENKDDVDSKGMPVPQGTIRRLDAISKSFLAH